MASNTENLDLLMKNPSTDGADTFNVQTMLNENWQKIDNNAGTVAQTLANILKPTTPPIIGLPPSTTPDGMFQALGNTGELHVWRKTAKASAGYTLGSVAQLVNLFGGNTGGSTFRSSSSFSVSDDGTLSLLNEDSRSLAVSWDRLVSFLNSGFKSKFIICEGYPNSVYYIPQDAEYSLSGNYLNVSKAQLVSGYPATYTTTYPVSTNPNAYQEGDDAKAAGYVVGEVVTGAFQFSNGNNVSPSWYYSDGISVSGDGKITLQSSAYKTLYDGNSISDASVLIGKFIMPVAQQTSPIAPFVAGMVYFIPSNATFSKSGHLYIDRYQPVTGYAAIPAGTTIEYLGKLGDKARVQVVSYVGTGTYGVDNPNSLTFDFVPKCVFLQCVDYGPYRTFLIRGAMYVNFKLSEGTSSQNHISWNSKTVSWYSTSYVEYQYNEAGRKYIALAIG